MADARGRRGPAIALTVLVALASAALLAIGCGAPREAAVHGPSVVLVVIDTLRADHMGLYGHSRPTTPALERAAQHALVFEHAFATSSWTLPSFASILTGTLPRRHAAGRLVGRDVEPSPDLHVGAMLIHGREKRFSALDSSAPSLPEILWERGYATAAVVNNPFLNPVFGLSRGFDLYDYQSGGDETSRRADEMVDRALDWIASRGDSPYFVLVHFFDPHMNYDAPEPIRGRFTGPLNPKGRFETPIRDTPFLRRRARSIGEARRRFIRAAYDEEIAFVDRELGRLLDQLRAPAGELRPLIVITADHGEELFDHESFGHGHTLFHEQLEVPLLLLGPGVRAGRTDTPVSIFDVAPTILEAVGVPVPAEMGGISLWPVASRGARPPERPIFAERTGEGPERRVVISWPNKLIVTDGAQRPELYDLAADPRERRNLAGEEPNVVANLRRQLATAPSLEGSQAPIDLDADTEGALRKLGYLSAP